MQEDIYIIIKKKNLTLPSLGDVTLLPLAHLHGDDSITNLCNS